MITLAMLSVSVWVFFMYVFVYTCVYIASGFVYIGVFKFKSSGLSYYLSLFLICDFSFSVKQSLKMSMEIENSYY